MLKKQRPSNQSIKKPQQQQQSTCKFQKAQVGKFKILATKVYLATPARQEETKST